MRRHVVFSAWIAATLAACGDSTSAPSGVRVGPEGATFTFEGASLSIPPGALDAQVELFLSASDAEPPLTAGRVPISRLFQLQPDKTRFLVPVTVTLPYLPERIPSSVRATLADLRRSDVSRIQERLDFITVEIEAATVSGETEGLGFFWSTAPEGPKPLAVTVSPASKVVYVGDTATFTAEVVDQSERLLPGWPVAWSTSEGAVATVDAQGTITALAPGLIDVVARAGSAQGKSSLSVASRTAFATRFSWENPVPVGSDLTAVSGDAASLVVGGDGASLARRTSEGWSLLYSRSGARLNAVAALVDGAVGVGVDEGGNGFLVQVSGAATSTLSVPATELTSVWTDGVAGMAVGTGPNVALLEAGVWRVEPSPTSDLLLAVGPASASLRVLGAHGAVYDWSVAGWVAVSQAELPEFLHAGVVRDGLAVGASDSGLWTFAASAWSKRALPSSPAMTVSRLSTAGSALLLFGQDGQEEMHLLVDDGSAFTEVALPQPAPAGVWGRAADELYAVGARGAIWAQGAGWTQLREGTDADVTAIAAFSSQAVVAAANGCADGTCFGIVLARTDANRFAPLGNALPSSLFALAGRSLTDLWAGGEGNQAYHWDGAGWQQRTLPAGLVGISAMAACSDGLYAASGATLLAESNGQLVSRFTSPLGGLNALGCGGGVLFAAGENGIVRVKDGVPEQLDPEDWDLRQAIWRAVWVSPEGKAFFGGEARYLLMWNGDRFEAYDRPGNLNVMRVTALWGTGFGDLWAGGQLVGGTSFLAHFNGAFWQRVEPKLIGGVGAISGLSTGEIWIGGQGILFGLP